MAPREPDDPLGPKHRPRRRGYPSGLLILPVDPVEARDPVLRTEHERRSMVDSAVYVAGKRVASPQTLAETYAELAGHTSGVAWIGLYRPDQRELASLAREFGLHELAVEDAVLAHQRPKLERYGDTLFVVLRAAHYLDASEEVEFGEVHLFVGPDFVVSVRHSEAPDLAAVRRRLEADARCCAWAPRRSSTRSWTASSTATRRSSRDWRTTSTRSRRRSSAATRGVATHLRADPRGHRVPAGDQAAGRHAAGSDGGVREVPHGRGTAALPARRRRPRNAGGGAGRRVPTAAQRASYCQRDTGRAATERGDEERRARQQRPER